jgi:5-hydroxyisourate hydrolase
MREDPMQAGGISIHAVDVAIGAPAAGLFVTLHSLDNGECEVASGVIGPNGLLDHPSARGQGISAGIFEARFAIGDYLRGQGIANPFLDIVPFRFVVHDITQHIHLPLKFTPYGFSLFRGV